MTDLNLLARVFVDYRRAYTVNAPACREIITLLNATGINVLDMPDDAVLAHFETPSSSATLQRPSAGRGGKTKPVDTPLTEDSTEDNS